MKKFITSLMILTLTCMIIRTASGEGKTYFVNPEGGRYYHSVRECKTVRASYHEGMIAITETQLEETQYEHLTKCNICLKDEATGSIQPGVTKFYYRSVYDTGDEGVQYTTGTYHSGVSIMPGIYTANSDFQCDGELILIGPEEQPLHSYRLQGEVSITFYLGDGASVSVPEHCVLQKVEYNPGFQKAYQRTTISHARYVTMLEMPGFKYCVQGIPGKTSYYVISTIQSEIGNEPISVVEIPAGGIVDLNLQGAYDVFVEFVNCVVWPSEQGEG